jgi:hypothetical protein
MKTLKLELCAINSLFHLSQTISQTMKIVFAIALGDDGSPPPQAKVNDFILVAALNCLASKITSSGS